MIMVLSCCDLLTIATSHPLTAIISLFWLTGYFTVKPGWVNISLRVTAVVSVSSILVLLVMNFDRYLAISHPIFHRTSVTKGRLLILVVLLISANVIVGVLSVNELILPYQVHVLIFRVIVFPLILFMNCKLLTVAWKSRKSNGTALRMRKTFSLKMLSSCLLVVACFAIMSIPTFAFVWFKVTSKDDLKVNDIHTAGLWSRTLFSMNSTFNCLIFYWKNTILRTEGMKVVKSMKICGRLACESYTEHIKLKK